jgi:hypothetical protein
MAALSEHDEHSNAGQPVTAGLHRRVYTVLLWLVAWFTLAVWSFAGDSVSAYLLFVVSGFLFIAVALPLILSRVQRAPKVPGGAIDDDVDGSASFREWRASIFDTWAGRLSGGQAAVQVLLPIAAAALGMTIFGITFVIVERSV